MVLTPQLVYCAITIQRIYIILHTMLRKDRWLKHYSNKNKILLNKMYQYTDTTKSGILII